MRQMKDSGVEWIGEIPALWKVMATKHLFAIVSGATPKSENPDYYDGEITWITPADYKTEDVYVSRGKRNITELGLNSCNTSLIPSGSIIFSKRAPIGSVAINLVELCTNQGCLSCIPYNKESTKYYYYFMSMFTEQYNLLGSGTTFKEISATSFSEFKMTVPSISEQIVISDYLDRKCANINNIIEKTKASIEEYKKLKQAIITQAVTKGVRGERPMKDSGIEWIGEIPEEWNDINPKALFVQRKDKARQGERQLTSSQLYGIIYQDEYMEMTGSKVVTVEKDFDILKHVEVGDFVISMRSFQGGLEYSTRTGSISSAYVMLIPNDEKVFSRYYRWLLKSSIYINALQSTSNMVRDGQAMRYSNFAQIRLLEVPLEEQKEIADYLDEKCEKIDILLDQKTRFIAELESYKKSMIYEYVTGKKEVKYGS